MPGFYYQDGANLRTMSQVYYQDGANLRTITEAWYQDGANLRKVWPVFNQLSSVEVESLTLAPATASSGIIVTNTGQVQLNTGSVVFGSLPQTWLSSGSAGDYDVRFAEISRTPGGLVVSNSAMDTWLNLATSRTISVVCNNTNNTFLNTLYELEFNLEFAAAGTGVVIGSSVVRLRSERSA